VAAELSEYDVLHDLVKRVKLPPQPKVLLAISEEMKKEYPGFDRIAGLIGEDPSLAAKVWKVVNSPFYRTSDKELPSLVQALSILGLRNFYCVVLASSLKDILGVTDATIKLWNHTVVVAKTSEMIARTTRSAPPDYAYLAGLFHDSSIPLLIEKEPALLESLKMVVSRGGDIESYEQENFNTSHAVVSYLFARSWQLPEEVCNAIQLHHSCDLSVFPSDESRQLGAVLMLADRLAREAEQLNKEQVVEDPCWREIETKVLDELGIVELDEFRSAAREFSQAES
jgi:putative nucleotidyltransferase with HDIG domain